MMSESVSMYLPVSVSVSICNRAAATCQDTLVKEIFNLKEFFILVKYRFELINYFNSNHKNT